MATCPLCRMNNQLIGMLKLLRTELDANKFGDAFALTERIVARGVLYLEAYGEIEEYITKEVALEIITTDFVMDSISVPGNVYNKFHSLRILTLNSAIELLKTADSTE